MKWIAASVSIVFLAGFVGANAGNHSNLPEAGTTPGSPFFGLEQAQESIGLALTFNPEKKAHKRIQIAQERLSEAKKLSEDNDSMNAEKAIQIHSKAMERAEQAIQNVPEDRRSNPNQELKNTRNQSISVLQSLKQRLPEAAISGIDTALESHMSRLAGNIPDNSGQNNRSDQEGNRTQESKSSEVDRSQEMTGSGYKATSRVVRD